MNNQSQQQQPNEVVRLKTEQDKQMEEEFRRRLEQNRQGNFLDVVRGK